MRASYQVSSKSGRRRRGWRQQRQRLEQRAHLLGSGQPLQRAISESAPLGGIGSSSAARPARRCPERPGIRLAARARRPPRRHAVPLRARAAKSTCAERSFSPGSSSTSAKSMPAHRLQGFAKAGSLAIAIIQDQRPPPWSAITRRDFFGQRGGGGRDFIDAAFGRAGARRRNDGGGRGHAAPGRNPARRLSPPPCARTSRARS